MAQQPGDEKENEGNLNQNPSEYGKYQCVFRAVDDSLYIMLKDTRSKRSFNNTFSKSTLAEMDLSQPVEKTINLLKEAKKAIVPYLKFKIGFGSAENTKKVKFNTLSKSYSKGCSMHLMVGIESSWMAKEHVFTLLEQKRTENDIMHDIISDMQEEIEELKKLKENKTPSIASWWSNFSAKGGVLTMDGVHIESTMKGMVELDNTKTNITFGIPGIYRVTATCNFKTCTGAGHFFQIRFNGTCVAARMGSNNGGFGTIENILEVKKGDKIDFYANHCYGTDKQHSSFTIQKL